MPNKKYNWPQLFAYFVLSGFYQKELSRQRGSYVRVNTAYTIQIGWRKMYRSGVNA